MNKIKYLLLGIILIVVFFYGFSVSNFEIFPYQSFKLIKHSIFQENNESKNFTYNDIDALVKIENENQVKELRDELIKYIWKENGFPTKTLEREIDITDNRYNEIKALKQIDKFIVNMDYEVDSKIYLFIPKNSNNKLVIYHQGHDGDFIKGRDTIEYLLQNDFHVLAFSMPLQGMNSKPIIYIENLGNIQFFSHDQFQFLESTNFSPIKFFLEPIAIVINSIEENYNFEEINMIGISGGGWTTTAYSAIDTRISKSISVAGGLPINLRNSINDKGDYEQTNPELYSISNFYEFYTLSGFGDNRKHILVFNKFDSCCYANPPTEIFEDIIKQKIEDLGGGSFEIFLDDTHYEHKISDYSKKLINTKFIDG